MAARRVLEGALSVVPGDSVVIVVDRARAELGVVLVDVARVVGARAEMFVLEELSPRPVRSVPTELAIALAEAQASVLLTSIEESEIAFRRELAAIVRERKLRHAHMVGVSRRSMVAGLSVDPARILNATRAVRTRMPSVSSCNRTSRTIGGSSSTTSTSGFLIIPRPPARSGW